MKKLLFFLSILLLAIAGCKLAPKTQLVQSKRMVSKTPVPPLPKGLKATEIKIAPTIVPTVPKLTYVPNDFALTSVRVQPYGVVLTWQNGTPPFQPQSKPDVLSGWVDYGPTTMLRSVTNPPPYGLSKAFFRIRENPSMPGQLQWVKTMQSVAASEAIGTGVASDSSGNTVAVGNFRGTMDLGKGPVSSAGFEHDVFMVKHNPQGTPLWVKTIGNTGADIVGGVVIDNQNNIIIAGSFIGSVDFGGGPLVSAGSSDIFVAKYTSANPPVLLWAKRFGGTWGEGANAVAVGANNEVFIGAWFVSVDANFGGVALSALGQHDIALVKLNPVNGQVLWAKRYGGTESEAPDTVTVDNAGNLWVGGRFSIATDVGTGPKANVDPVNYTTDVFLAKYSGANGSCLSAKIIGSPGSESIAGIAHDSATDNIYIVGTVSSPTDFGGGANYISRGRTAFLAGYAGGNFLWLKTWGGTDTFSQDGSSAVAVRDGSIAVTGSTTSFIDFGGGPLLGGGITTVSFTLNGNSLPVYQWAKRASHIDSSGNAVTFDGVGHVVTTGQFPSRFDFGGIIAGIQTSYKGAFVAQHAK